MIIAVPAETLPGEKRVALTPGKRATMMLFGDAKQTLTELARRLREER